MDTTGRRPASFAWPEWRTRMAAYQQSSARRACAQLANTLGPYGLLVWAMIHSVRSGWPYPVTLALALPAALFLVRIFILFHDCVHGAFFASPTANAVVGNALGILVYTSFDNWRFSHLRHHVSYANLDARGFGDIWTVTVAEYQAWAPPKRLCYRLYRNPLVLLGIGAVFTFVLSHRLPGRAVKRKEIEGAVLTNLLLMLLIVAAGRTIGYGTFAAVQLPVIWMAGALGVWLFYVQHQFDGVYWSRGADWNPLRAALEGASFYRLPPLLRWFSGNIGYHHVHHLWPHIPNYRLVECFNSFPELQTRPALSLRASGHCIRLKLWDEARRRMVGFSTVKSPVAT